MLTTPSRTLEETAEPNQELVASGRRMTTSCNACDGNVMLDRIGGNIDGTGPCNIMINTQHIARTFQWGMKHRSCPPPPHRPSGRPAMTATISEAAMLPEHHLFRAFSPAVSRPPNGYQPCATPMASLRTDHQGCASTQKGKSSPAPLQSPSGRLAPSSSVVRIREPSNSAEP